jgi:hypothetical protein
MRELVTERCRILAPKKLTALLGEEACGRPGTTTAKTYKAGIRCGVSLLPKSGTEHELTRQLSSAPLR